VPKNLLLVEDDDGDAFLVQELLADEDPALLIVRARDVAEAKSELRGWTPDVILLDLGLPDSTGSGLVEDVCAAASGSPVIVLTGLGDEQRGAAAVAAGAQDFLVKGQVDAATLLRSMRFALRRKEVGDSQRDQLTAEVRAQENARLERGLLPQPFLRDPHVTISTRYRPGRHQSLIGGDFFDIVEVGDGSVHLIVGDVAGHGADAAALGVLLRSAWRGVVLAGTHCDRVLPLLSEVLCLERQSDEIFATAVYLVIDPDRRSVTVFNAGHPRPLSLSGEVSAPWPERHGPMLGIPLLDEWRSIRVEMPGTWPLMLYTDGLIEGHASEGRLGEDGLVAFLGAELAIDGGIATLPDRVIDRVEEANGGALPDDVAIVIVDVDESAARVS
jgi:serine phosphatase RsbU (regulator of sigma subunit)